MNQAIHAAVRRDLDRLDAALGTVAEPDRRRAADLRRAWDQLQAQLHHHHTQEEELVFPALAGLGLDPELVEALEAEHATMLRALEDVDVAMRTFTASASVADATAAGEAVRRARVVVERHLAHEEAELEPAMLRHVGSPEWKDLQRRLRRQPPRTTGWFLAWLEDGAAPDARAFLAAEVPAPARFVLGRVAGRGYHRTIAPVWR